MDRYQKVEKPKPESPINENEIRITTQGAIRTYITSAPLMFDYLSVWGLDWQENVLCGLSIEIVSLVSGFKAKAPVTCGVQSNENRLF
ncbi:unnamed protein product [Sphenostylis stenocarpa]|uniref:Uncharacterized protein n=1 Tax=Sphenostylis stenocarpa TaxID=92480 RepID=A0AA86RV45_9FABA|nr:unnamed protein product [Sphenostylis stenocarpa]